MGDRSRLRVGRGVLYTPTAAEATAQGDGPWAAKIVDVNSDGTVDLTVFPPSVETALPSAATAVAQADPNANGVGYVQADVVSIEDLAAANKVVINVLVTLVNAMRLEAVNNRKTSVALGGDVGQFSVEGVTAI